MNYKVEHCQDGFTVVYDSGVEVLYRRKVFENGKVYYLVSSEEEQTELVNVRTSSEVRPSVIKFLFYRCYLFICYIVAWIESIGGFNPLTEQLNGLNHITSAAKEHNNEAS